MRKNTTLSDALRVRIKQLANEQNLSILKLSKFSHIPYSTLSSFLTNRCSSITIATLHKICEGLKISLYDFFDDPIFNNL